MKNLKNSHRILGFGHFGLEGVPVGFQGREITHFDPADSNEAFAEKK